MYAADDLGDPERVHGGFSHPARTISGAFAGAIAAGAAVLSLPMATTDGHGADLLTALFTATSAICVTGLTVVDTETYWSRFGQIALLLMIQIGGLGIMTLASLVALKLARRVGLRARLVAQAETKTLTAADLGRVIARIVVFSLSCELVIGTVLSLRFWLGYGQRPGAATYSGVFHAISAFNNAGFSLYSDNLVRYVADPWVNLAVIAAVILGGLGFPVIFELARSWRKPRTWSVLTRVTVITTVGLLVIGTALMALTEARNARTFGPLHGGHTLMAAFFASTVARTAGFNTVDVGALKPATLLINDILMFIGGGSAGTAGGIKVTTFGLLGYVIWSEMRGEPDVTVGRRRISGSTQRQALAVALLGVGLVVTSAVILLEMTAYSLDVVLFEAVSAFATVGLSTGITGDLPTAGRVLLVILMFAGRTGPLTVASALAVRDHTRHFRLPEERTIVG